jgi:hypothetical protein
MKSVTAFGRDTFQPISILFHPCLYIDQVKYLHSSTLGMFLGRPPVWAIGHHNGITDSSKGPVEFSDPGRLLA